jgi:hypothetical protein
MLYQFGLKEVPISFYPFVYNSIHLKERRREGGRERRREGGIKG